MTIKALFLVIALTAPLLGCSSAATRSMNQRPCNEGTCFIDVTVTDCRISVEPVERHIERTNKGPVIHWSLDPGSFMAYRYSERGISFKRNPDGEFHSPGPSNLGKHFVWTDKNSLPGSYPYTINVVKRFTGEPCPPHDPSVVND